MFLPNQGYIFKSCIKNQNKERKEIETKDINATLCPPLTHLKGSFWVNSDKINGEG